MEGTSIGASALLVDKNPKNKQGIELLMGQSFGVV